jgi:hypothetical protein
MSSRSYAYREQIDFSESNKGVRSTAPEFYRDHSAYRVFPSLSA